MLVKNDFLMENLNFIKDTNQEKGIYFPDKGKALSFIRGLFNLLFCSELKGRQNPDVLEQHYKNLQRSLLRIFIETGQPAEEASEYVKIFFREVPEIYNTLLTDAKATFEHDPAASSVQEIFFTYPGFFATALQRFAHQLWKQELKAIARIITSYAHSQTSIDIHPAVEIGEAFVIDHGAGIVIGESCAIGDHVKMYQNVTLGALHVEKNMAGVKRHPTIQEHVTLYSNATVLGGETIIGHHSVIGGKVFLVKSVPSFSKVYQENFIKVDSKFDN